MPAARTLSIILALILSATAAFAGGKGAQLGQMCGGIAGIACAKGLWCDPEPGICGGADIAGKCVRSSKMCTREYRPVCGCNGKTYSNDCGRRAAKQPMHHKGKCA